MKVLHILDHSIPLHSGYTFRTRAILKQQHAFGIETSHITSPKHGNDAAQEETIDGLKFYRSAPPQGLLSKLPAFNQLSFVTPIKERMLEVIERETPDILHAHSPVLNALAAIKAARIAKLPLVYEIRAFWEDAAVDHGACKEGGFRYRLTRKLETYAVKQADAVTVICEGLKQDLINRGIEPAKISIIPNAVNLDQFEIISSKDTKLTKSLHLQNCKVLGFLGSFYDYEGLDILISAMPLIIKQYPTIRLLLVGGGPQERNLKALAEALGVSDKVIFTSRVPHDQVSRYYSLVDLLVYPRKQMRLTELVTPLKPLEAMAQGKPVLASDVGGHRELINDNENGYLFKANNIESLVDKIVDIIGSEDESGVIISGRKYVEEVRNWKNSVSNYLPVYERLCREKR